MDSSNAVYDDPAPCNDIVVVYTYVPSSSGPAPLGAPYQVALAASQLGSAVKSAAVKLTGLAHEPQVTRREKMSAPSAITMEEEEEEDAIVASSAYSASILADRRTSAFR